LAILFRFTNDILPDLSSSKESKTFCSSSRVSDGPILAVIISRNSGNSMLPEPSESTSVIIFFSSSFLTWMPRAFMAAFSSR